MRPRSRRGSPPRIGAHPEPYDRGDELHGSLAMPSLAHVLLISQNRVSVELHSRQSDGSFRYELLRASSARMLPAIDVEIEADAVDEGVFELTGEASELG